MPPTILCADVRGQAVGGPARVGVLTDGLFFTQIGTDIVGGWDPSRVALMEPSNLVTRFRGQLYFIGVTAGTLGSIYVYDEGGTDDWITGVSAKGGRGTTINPVANGAFSGLYTVNTANQDYLVVFTNNSTPYFYRYDPDTGVNGTWTSHNLPGAHSATATWTAIVYKGLLFCVTGQTNQSPRTSFDPVSGGTTSLPFPAALVASSNGRQFVIQDRLFSVWSSHFVGAGSTWVEEFTLGAWAKTVTAVTFKSGAQAANIAVIPISATKVLAFGGGGPVGSTGVVDNGLQCWLLEVTSPAAVITATDVTNAVIPVSLRPGTIVSSADDFRVYAMVDNDSNPGTPSYWLYFMPDGAVQVTAATLFQVTDEFTELLNVGSPASDSDFAYANNFYGGGDRFNGIDGSTKLVTVSPRGYASGTTGLVVSCSAHGDATVVAHGVVAGGPYTVGELVTGSVSGATGLVIGDGAAQGLYLRSVAGTFQGTDGAGGPDTLTGGSSAATSTCGTVIRHGPILSGPFEVGESVVGTGGGTGVITHLGAAAELIKIDTVTGTWLITDTITQTSGANSGASASATSGPLGSTGGAADKTIRVRFFLSAASKGLGTPVTGFCSMVPSSGSRGTVVIDGGGAGIDELQGVVADGAVGGDAKISFEWDFLADGVPSSLVDNVQFEIDRV